MKDLIKKVLVEHLLMEGDHPLLYDKYEFDGTSVSHFKTGTNVFLDNSVNIVDDTFGDTECIENTDICIPFTTLIAFFVTKPISNYIIKNWLSALEAK